MKAFLFAAAFLCSLCWAGTNPYNIIPEPVKVTTASGTTKNLKILNEQKVSGLGNEGYTIKLTPGGVELRYTTPNGKAMAMQPSSSFRISSRILRPGCPAAASRMRRISAGAA